MHKADIFALTSGTEHGWTYPSIAAAETNPRTPGLAAWRPTTEVTWQEHQELLICGGIWH